MDYVKRVYSQPNARSLKEGEEVVYLGKGKPLARYRKEGGQVWVSYMSTDGNLYVDKDFNVQGTISQGGTGGTGTPVVKGGLVPMTAGGMGANISANTGTMYIASAGTVSTGTLPVNQGGTAVTANTSWINSNVVATASGVLAYDGNAVAPSLPSISGTLTIAKGGTSATDSNAWLNSRVEMNTDGTLDYAASGSGAVTMNTLTDANDIRGRVTAGLASNGDVNRTVSTAKGGLGADFSGTATGFIRIVNGTTAQRSYANAKSDMSLNNVANVDQTDASNITSGTLSNTVQDNITRVGTVASGTWGATAVAVDKGGTGAITAAAAKASLAAATTFRQSSDDPGVPVALAAGDIWVDTFANNKQYRATAAGDDAITAGEWEEVTIEAAGMDAVAGVVIYSDPVESGTSDGDERATSASRLWAQSGTTATAKISINYYHESANESMKLACHLCTADSARAASALLGVYPVSTGGSLTTGSTPNMSSASAGPVTVSTTKITFDGTIVTGALDITGLTNNVLYKVVVLLNNADASTNTLMTSPTIIVYGS